MSYIVPGIEVHQDLSILPKVLVDDLRACIIGPGYTVINRYGVDDEGGIDLGVFTGTAAIAVLYASLAPLDGYVVDHDTIRVVLGNALAKRGTITPTETKSSVVTVPGSYAKPINIGDVFRFTRNSITYDSHVVRVTNKGVSAGTHQGYIVTLDYDVTGITSFEHFRPFDALDVTASLTSISDSGFTIPQAINIIVDGEGSAVTAEGTYLCYRALPLTPHVIELRTVESLSEVVKDWGTIHPDNPLAYALSKALANSGGVSVRYIALNGNDEVDYADALEALEEADSAYTLVPLTTNRTIQRMVAAHVEGISSPTLGRWRICFLAAQTDGAEGYFTSAAITVDVGASTIGGLKVVDDAGTAQAVTSMLSISAVENNHAPAYVTYVRAGDTILLGSGETLTIKTVTANTLTVIEDISSLNAAYSGVTFIRNYTTSEIVRNVSLEAGSYQSRRVYYTWPDLIEDYVDDELTQVPAYFYDAAIAGQISGVAPHQGLTNVELSGFASVSRTTEFLRKSHLNDLAEAGVYIITQQMTGSEVGMIYCRHEVSTEAGKGINYSELMVTKNVDAISYVIFHAFEPYVGRTNITPSMTAKIANEVEGVIAFLKSEGYTQTLGAMLIDATITSIAVDPLLPDRLVCNITLTIPYPLNNLEFHLVV